MSKNIIWVSDGVDTKQLSIKAIFSAIFRVQDRNLYHFISDHATLKATKTYLTVVFEPQGPICSSFHSNDTMGREIYGLNKRGCFSVVNRSLLSP